MQYLVSPPTQGGDRCWHPHCQPAANLMKTPFPSISKTLPTRMKGKPLLSTLI